MIGILIQIGALVLAYLFGSIPVALIVGKKIKGLDIREHGSKNMGATNAFRVLGFKWGLITFIFDAIKGGIMIVFMKYIIIHFSFYTEENFPFVINSLAYGFAAFIGHLFPIFAKFKGGKGVSTGFGSVLAYAPIPALFCLIIFITVVSISRFVSLASVISFIIAPFSVWIYCMLFEGEMDWWLFGLVLIISLIVIIKHVPNLKRLKVHDEQKVNFDAIEDETQPAFVDDERKGK